MLIGSALHNIILSRNEKDENECHRNVCCVKAAVTGEINDLPRAQTQRHKHMPRLK